MGLLKRCPQCYAKLQANENAIHICKVCGYLTKSGTVRPEALVIHDSIILPTWGEEDEYDFEDYMH
jgi:ribosomal protein L37AE/L43A